VCFCDPRPVLERGEQLTALVGDDKLCTRLKVPASFLPALSAGTMELGEMDDPENTW
jgi:hypothetical protein